MRIIDAHLHYHKNPHFDQIARVAGHENTEENLRRSFQDNGVEIGIVMGNRGLTLEEHQYPDFLRYCVGLDRYALDGREWNSAIDLVEQHLKRTTCVGIKLYPGYSPYYVSDSGYGPIYELAEQFHKPVAIHTGALASRGGMLKYSHPLTVDQVAVEFPNVQFVMCHMGNPWVMDAAAVIDKNDNVAADLSGLLEGRIDVPAFFRDMVGYTEYLRTWLAYLGSWDRLMYGTDWPLVNIGDYIEFISRLIPEKYHEMVFFKNAHRIYQL